MLTLTDAEKELFCRLCQGQTLKEIAVEMKVHNKTIDLHVSKVKKRFGFRSTPQAICELMTMGLLADSENTS